MSSSTSFNFNDMIDKLTAYTDAVKKQMAELSSKSTGGNVDLATMFKLQFQMQMMSQYIEAMSNVLSSVHQEMMTMARATKGQ